MIANCSTYIYTYMITLIPVEKQPCETNIIRSTKYRRTFVGKSVRMHDFVKFNWSII